MTGLIKTILNLCISLIVNYVKMYLGITRFVVTELLAVATNILKV